MQAAGQGHVETVKELIKLGANVNARSFSDTPLIKAAYNGHLEVVKELVSLSLPSPFSHLPSSSLLSPLSSLSFPFILFHSPLSFSVFHFVHFVFRFVPLLISLIYKN